MPEDKNEHDFNPNVSSDEFRKRLEKRRRKNQRLREMLRRGVHSVKRLRRWLTRAKKREEAQNQGAAGAVAWALSKVGTTESPPGSNLGPGADGITAMQRFTGYAVPPGVFWCGCFVAWAVCKVGAAMIPAVIRLGFNGYIVDDARARRNGLTAVPVTQAKKGDIVTYTFPHIELVVEDYDGSGYVDTVGGNTSSQSDPSGSQNNGGGVYRRRRPISQVAVCARPAY